MLILSCLPQADPVCCAAVLHEVPESCGALRVLRPAEGGPPRAVHLRGEAGVSVPGRHLLAQHAVAVGLRVHVKIVLGTVLLWSNQGEKDVRWIKEMC